MNLPDNVCDKALYKYRAESIGFDIENNDGFCTRSDEPNLLVTISWNNLGESVTFFLQSAVQTPENHSRL